MPILIKKQEKVVLSTKDYQALLEAYKKIGSVLAAEKKKKIFSPLKTLYGIWQGVKVNEEDFAETEKSLFRTSL